MATDSTVTAALRAIVGADDPDLAGQLVVTCDVTRNLVAGGTEAFRAATNEYATQPTDADPNEPYYARLRVPSYTQSIFEKDWRRSGAVEYSVIELLNPDGYLDDEFDPSVYRWKGATLSLCAGLKTWAKSAFKQLPGGQQRVVDVLPGEEIVTLIVVPEETRLDQPVQQNLYPGHGAAYDFAGTAQTDCGDVFDLGLRDATITIRFKTSVSGSNMTLIDKRGTTSGTAGSPGFVAWQRSSDDKIIIRIDDGSNVTAHVMANTYNDGEWHETEFVISRTADELRVGVDGVEDATPQDISSITGRLSSSIALHHGQMAAGSANIFDGELDEPSIYYRALEWEELLDRSKYAVDGYEPGLVGAWLYDEDTGTHIGQAVPGPMVVQAGFDGSLSCDMGNNHDVASESFVLSGWGRVDSGNGGVMAGKRRRAAGTQPGYNARFSSGDFIFEIGDGSGVKTLTIAGDYDDSTPYGWMMGVDRANDLLHGFVLDYVRGTVTVGTPVDISGVGSLTNTRSFKLGDYDLIGQDPFTGALSWIFFSPTLPVDLEDFARVVLSEQAVILDDGHPIPPPTLTAAAETSGAAFYPLNENTGSTAVDQIGAVNGTFNKAPTWVDRHGDLTPGLAGSWTGTDTGFPDIKGLPIPIALGRPQRFTPVWLDANRLKLQYSDPSHGATEEVESVWKGTKKLTLTTDYTVDLTNSIITLVATPDEPITVTVKGVKSGGRWLQFPGELIEFVWEDVLGVTNVESGTTDAYDKLHPYQQGVWLGPCDQTLLCLYNRLLAPDGHAIRTLDNEMALRTRVVPGTATAALTLKESGIASVEPIRGIPPPTWLARVSFDRTISKLSAWDTSSTLGDRIDHSQGQQYVEDRLQAVKDLNPEAIIRTFDTALDRRSDAALNVQRVLAVDGFEQEGWIVECSKDHWPVDVLEEVLIESYSRYNLTGKQFAVVKTDYGLRDGMPTTLLYLWRPVTS